MTDDERLKRIEERLERMERLIQEIAISLGIRKGKR